MMVANLKFSAAKKSIAALGEPRILYEDEQNPCLSVSDFKLGLVPLTEIAD